MRHSKVCYSKVCALFTVVFVLIMVLEVSGCSPKEGGSPSQPLETTNQDISPDMTNKATLSESTETPTPSPTKPPTPTPVEPTTTSLEPSNNVDSVNPNFAVVFFSPLKQMVNPPESVIISVVIDPKQNGVSGVDMTISFDSRSIQVVNIHLGEFLGLNPVYITKQIDNTAGILRISAARVGETSPPSPSDIYIYVEFHIPDQLISNETSIEIHSVKLINEQFTDIENVVVKNATLYSSN